jgi:hypothetical protein
MWGLKLSGSLHTLKISYNEYRINCLHKMKMAAGATYTYDQRHRIPFKGVGACRIAGTMSVLRIDRVPNRRAVYLFLSNKAMIKSPNVSMIIIASNVDKASPPFRDAPTTLGKPI